MTPIYLDFEHNNKQQTYKCCTSYLTNKTIIHSSVALKRFIQQMLALVNNWS